MRLIRACSEHPLAAVMVYLGLLLFGATALSRLNVELLPALEIPVACVITEYPGIPADEVEQLVTIPLENALSSVKGVKKIDSVTKEGISAVSLRFDWGTDIETAAVEIRERIDAIFPFLPHGLQKPFVFSEDLADTPVMSLAVLPLEGKELGPQLGWIIDKELKTRLLQVSGVADLRVLGGDEKEIRVDLDPFKLAAAGLSVLEIIRTVGSSLYDYPVGTVKEQDLELLVRATTGVKGVQDLGRIPLSAAKSGTGLSLAEVAEITQGIKQRTSFFHYNGREAVGIILKKTGTVGTLNAARNIERALPELRELFKRDFTLEVLKNGAQEIREAILNLVLSLLLGILAAFLVLLPIFRQPVIPLITIASVPVSASGVFLFMYVSGISLNIISLAGIAMGIGMLVDNSIVVLDNLQENGARTPGQIARYTAQMGSSTFGSTITTLLVFLPIFFLPGLTGALFKELALTLSFLIGTSFITSMTLTPALYALAGKKGARPGPNPWMSGLRGAYSGFLRRGLQKTTALLLSFLSINILAFLLYQGLPKEIMPQIDQGRLSVRMLFPQGFDLARTSRLSAEIERSLLALPGVRGLWAESGYERTSLKDRAEKGREASRARLEILLEKRRRIGAVEVGRLIEEGLKGMEGVSGSVEFPEDIYRKLLGSPASLTLVVTGQEREQIMARAGALARELQEQGLLLSCEPDTREDVPLLRFQPARDSLSNSSVPVLELVEHVSAAVRGSVAGSLKTGSEEIDVRVGLKRAFVDSTAELERLKLPTPSGWVDLGRLGSFRESRTFGELFRCDRKAAVTLQLVPRAAKAQELKALLAGRQDKELRVTESSLLEANLKEIGFAFFLALVLMYLFLGAQFESFADPLLLLSFLPLSAAGSLLLLFLGGKSLNISSFFGILILLGTTINTAILLRDSFESGVPASIRRGSLSRLRPVLATNATTILALLPIALNPFREGALQRPMAVTMIGGLSAGTLLTLLFFPPAYAVLHRQVKGGPRARPRGQG